MVLEFSMIDHGTTLYRDFKKFLRVPEHFTLELEN